MDSVVLTGSSGTIGTEVGLRLLERDIDVIGVDRAENRWSDELDAATEAIDLRDRDSLRELPNDPDLILHFAAHSRVTESVERPLSAPENIEMTYKILEYARRVGGPPLVFASSREVYGDTDGAERSEDKIQLNNANNPYAASKIGCEALIHAYRRCYEIDATILRFSNVYGKYDVSDRVVPIFVARALRDKPLHVYGSGKIMDFLHIEDCADGIFQASDCFPDVEGKTFNIASGEGTSLVELAEMIIDVTESNSEIHVESNRDGEVETFVASIGRARRDFNFNPEYSIRTGIEHTVSWYRNHQQLLDEIL